jgi:hypothetical protein
VGFVSLVTELRAHHSNAPHYDANRPVSVAGTVAGFEFVNPHSYLHIDVTEADGSSVEWNCEMPAAVMLRRQGWSADAFVPGQQVTVRGIAARRDEHGCSVRSVTLADRTEVSLQGGAVVAANAEVPEPTSNTAGRTSPVAGIWMRDSERRPNGPATGPGPAVRRPPPDETFTRAGLEAQAEYDQRFDDPSFSCSASSIVRAWSGPGTPTAIEIAGERLTIRHEFMDTVRTVDLSTREHPQGLTPAAFGHSIGWFEGETLVIDTVGYAAGVLSPHPGILHSDALHTIERLSVDAAGTTLSVAWTAENPKFFSEPLSGEFLYKPSPYAVERFDCTVENANR